ncbi:hypothetical protein L3V86_08310 [Thiotrichales bacterium 19S11-10]|nr:hypothetical protein [Thiotrichales bacterium 19S11-10]
MPQFRLTQKMAKKLQIETLNHPQVAEGSFYDDWVLDTIKVKRKDIVVFMHVRTRMALAMPLHEIGGAKNILSTFPVSLEWHINELLIEGYEDYGTQIRRFFDQSPCDYYFCKTDNRSVMTHLNQFKAILEDDIYSHDLVSQLVCDKSIAYWYTSLITNPENKKIYTRPQELWETFLCKDNKG